MKNKINKHKKAIYTTLAVVFWLILWQVAAMIYGMDFCDEEEKRLIQSYIVMKTVRIDPRTEPNSTDDLFEAALKRSIIEMRKEDAESCN